MKITLEADLPGDEPIEPIVFEHISLFGFVGRIDGIVGQINPPVVQMHGNLWDVHRLFGEARDRTLVFTLQRLGLVPLLEKKEVDESKSTGEMKTADAVVN